MNVKPISGKFSKQWLSRYRQILSLIRLHKPRSIVEVGAFTGERASGMIEEAVRHHPEGGVTYTGYDLFEDANGETDATEFNVRPHPKESNVADRLQRLCDQFKGRAQFRLVKGNTRETLQPQRADLAFIDGGHSVETIQSDYNALSGSDVVILDDYYESSGGRTGPDTKKVGCNALVADLTDFSVLPTHNPVTGGGRVKLVVRFGSDRLRGVRVRPDGPLMPYFYHDHNCGSPASLRRTERTLEMAVAMHWLGGVGRDPRGGLVEVGAVTPYYSRESGYAVGTVIDPADAKATQRVSLFDHDIAGKDVLSLSTIEHIGAKQYDLKEDKTPVQAFEYIATKSRRFLISIPYGWVNSVVLEKKLLAERGLLAEAGINVYTVTRQADETWQASDDLKPYGTREKPWANTVIIAERGGLL